MPKRAKRSVFRQVVVTETHVVFGIIDGRTGKAHMYKLDWDEMEEFVKKHGDELPAGDLPRRVSGHVRDLMESGD